MKLRLRPRLLAASFAVLAVAAAAPAAATRPAAPGPTARVFLLRGEQLAAVQRPITGDAAAGALEALFAGPTSDERRAGFRTTVPRTSRIVSVSVEDGVAFASVRVPRTGNGAFERSLRPAQFEQLRATLDAVPGVRRITLLVNGTAPLIALRPEPPPAEDPALRPAAPAPRDVRTVQEKLVGLGYLPVDGASGVWDYRTEHAVLAFQSWQGLERDGIVGPRTRAALDAAEAPTPTHSGRGRWIEVYNHRGVALLVRNGIVEQAIHVSTGAAGFETPTGSYRVFWKERFSWSVPYRVWLPYASYFNRGIAFHAHAEVPTRPASHGCVRVPYPEARRVYRFAAHRTPVYVYR